MDESMTNDQGKTLPTLILETSAVAFERQRETEEMEGGGEKTKVETMHTTER